ncbi:MAG: glycosyltransferase family 4 protein [Bacteroidales bacterium]|nr:glycosyltransferase family 4 protein [Bacteroidales bacterium]
MKLKSRFYRFIERFLSRFTDRIVCISEAEKESAVNNNIGNEGKLSLIPNGIDVQAVTNAKPKSRNELGITNDTFVVGMVGRISKQKAPDIFIKAAKLVKEQVPNSAFIIVGDGELRPEIEKYASENNLQLLITGWTDEPYSYLKVFDVAVLPSRWEGFGLAVVEYMAAGKNVVATRIDALPTIIDDKVDGLLVEVDSPENLCEKIIWLHKHPDEAALMRQKALTKVIAIYDIHRVAKQHFDMFEQLMDEGKIVNNLI